ncbi:hypothetical protein GX50_06064, partial [[Emmonsia] crescens]
MTLLLLALTWASVCVLPGNAQNDHIGIKVGLNVGGQPPAPGGKSGPPALIDIDAAILISWCNHHHKRTCPPPGYPVTVTVTETKNHTITVPTTTTETTVTTLPASTTTLPGSTIVTTTTTTAPGETITLTLPGSYTTDTVTSTVLTAVSLCPSRTLNPTFTPVAPVPTNYLWGCPPGKLCIPNRSEADGDCNFEVGLPSPEFFCNPDECHPSPPREPYQDWDPTNSTDRKFFASPHYYNLNPRIFGLDYDIFVFRNSTPEEPYPTAYPTQYPTQSPPQSPTQYPTQYPTKYPTQYPTEYPTKYPSKYPSKYPTLRERQISDKLPSQCYLKCNAAGLEGEDSGLDKSILCVENSLFKVYLAACHRCIALYAGIGNPKDALREKTPNFVSILDLCEAPPGETSPPPGQ